MVSYAKTSAVSPSAIIQPSNCLSAEIWWPDRGDRHGVGHIPAVVHQRSGHQVGRRLPGRDGIVVGWQGG